MLRRMRLGAIFLAAVLTMCTFSRANAENAGLIAFSRSTSSGQLLRIMRPNGQVVTDIDGAGPAWAPDGKRIAFSGNVWDNSPATALGGIVVARADGRGVRQLTRGPDGNPSWSPDGKRIAFDRTVCGLMPLALCTMQIWTMGADGSNQLPLAALPGSEPAWSPDGRSIAYAADPAIAGVIGVGAASASSIVVVPVAGGAPAPISPPGVNAYEPVWSPDGKWIAFGGTELPSGKPAEWVARRDGSSARKVAARANVWGWHPAAWSRYGALAIANGAGISVARADGSGLRRLVAKPATSVSWSPDAHQLVASTHGGIVIIDASRGTTTLVDYSYGQDGDSAPAWSPR